MPIRPNFLILMTDQQRADHLGCAAPHGSASADAAHPVLRTPHLDALAGSGVRFTRAYVTNPLCMPGRATLITGLTPRAHGVRTNGISLSPALPTLGDALRQAGYRTHQVGKFHFQVFGAPRGVDPQALNPAAYAESRWTWQQGKLRRLPLPYYGFESAEFVGGHGGGVWGEYTNWLRETHPGAERLLAREAGTPPASGAEQSWKMALPAELHYNTWIADRAIAYLEQTAAPAARAGRPFLLWASFPDPHHPFCPPQPWADRYDPATVPLPLARRPGELAGLPPHFQTVFERPLQLSGRRAPTDIPDAQLRGITALTYGMVSFVDEQVGRILATLERLGLREDTVVVFLSDHGDMLGDHWLLNKGPFHFDGILKVPFIWRWPGRFREGVATPALASLLDFAPTILDLAGVPIPERLGLWEPPPEPEAPEALPPWPGRSLAPVLTGAAERVQDSIVVEDDEDYLGLRLRTLVTARYQVTVYAGRPYGELFDLQEDPGQLYNLWDRPEHQRLKRELQAQLLDRLVETDLSLPRRLCHA